MSTATQHSAATATTINNTTAGDTAAKETPSPAAMDDAATSAAATVNPLLSATTATVAEVAEGKKEGEDGGGKVRIGQEDHPQQEEEEDDSSVISSTTDSTQSSEDISQQPHTRNLSNGESNDPMVQPKDAHELYTRALQHKQEGNELFQVGQYDKAARSYRKGTSILKHWSAAGGSQEQRIASGEDNVMESDSNTPREDLSCIEEQIKALLLTLQTNLSMVCFQQNKFQQSKDIASKVLDTDSQNVKALYRRAMAYKKLGEMSAAKQDLKLACTVDPTNRAVKKELYTLQKEMEQEKQSQRARLAKAFSAKGKSGSFLYGDKEEEERKKELDKRKKEEEEQKAREKRKLEWEEECVKRLSIGEEAISFQEFEKQVQEKEKKAREELKRKEKEQKEKERQAKKKLEKENNTNGALDSEVDSDDEVLTEKEMQMLRGYKKTKDGRTTSYFTREQSEAEKKLLGNIAPKRLDASASMVPQRLDSMQSVSSTKSASVWNNAGTWEEKDTSEWCNGSLKSFLKNASVEIDLYSGKVSEVNSLTGDASVAFVSGKKRYVFDYSATIKYEIMDEGDDVVAKGTLKLPDISSASIHELEIEVMAWKNAPRMEIETVVGKCRDALIANIRQQVLAFVNAFNEQY